MSPYSVAQSSSAATLTSSDFAMARVRSHPRTSTPAAINRPTICGTNSAATFASTSSVPADRAASPHRGPFPPSRERFSPSHAAAPASPRTFFPHLPMLPPHECLARSPPLFSRRFLPAGWPRFARPRCAFPRSKPRAFAKQFARASPHPARSMSRILSPSFPPAHRSSLYSTCGLKHHDILACKHHPRCGLLSFSVSFLARIRGDSACKFAPLQISNAHHIHRTKLALHSHYSRIQQTRFSCGNRALRSCIHHDSSPDSGRVRKPSPFAAHPCGRRKHCPGSFPRKYAFQRFRIRAVRNQRDSAAIHCNLRRFKLRFHSAATALRSGSRRSGRCRANITGHAFDERLKLILLRSGAPAQKSIHIRQQQQGVGFHPAHDQRRQPVVIAERCRSPTIHTLQFRRGHRVILIHNRQHAET